MELMIQLRDNLMELLSKRDNLDDFLTSLDIDPVVFNRNRKLLTHFEKRYPSLKPLIEQLSEGHIMIEGLQSAGKSSLFAMLSGFKTEIRGGETSTRQAIVYDFIPGNQFHATVHHGDNQKNKKSFHSPEALNRYLATTQGNIPGKITAELLYVEITGPQYINMRIVDFPGDIKGNAEENKIRNNLYQKFYINSSVVHIRALKGDQDHNHDPMFSDLAQGDQYLFKLVVITHAERTLREQLERLDEGIKPIFTKQPLYNDCTPLFIVDCPKLAVDNVCEASSEDKQEIWRQEDSALRDKLRSLLSEKQREVGSTHDLPVITDGAVGIEPLSKVIKYLVFHRQRATLQVLAPALKELIISENKKRLFSNSRLLCNQ